MSSSAVLTGRLPRRQQEPGTKRREANDPIPQSASDASEVSKNKRRKIKDEAEGSLLSGTARRHDQRLATVDLVDIKPDLVDLKRFQAMDDILRTMASGMTTETFRDAATEQVLELAIGQDLSMLPGEAALRDCRERLLRGGMVQLRDMDSAYVQVRRRLALQCGYWQAVAMREEKSEQAQGTSLKAPSEKSGSRCNAVDAVTATGTESPQDQDESHDDEEADPTHVEMESAESTSNGSGEAVLEESDADADSDSSDDSGSSVVASQAPEPVQSSKTQQPKHLQPTKSRPRKRHKGSALPTISHINIRGQDCITATNNPHGNDLFLAVAIDDLRKAGHSVEDSPSMRQLLETEVNKIWNTLSQNDKKRWGRHNSDLRRDLELPYNCVQRLRGSQEVQWRSLFEYFKSQAARGVRTEVCWKQGRISKRSLKRLFVL